MPRRKAPAAALQAGALALGLVLANIEARAGDYAHPDKAFSASYDDALWMRNTGQDELAIECAPAACEGAAAGCFVTAEPDPDARAGSIANFNGDDLAGAQIEAFAEQKADLETRLDGIVSWDKAASVAPQIVRAYAPQEIGGQPYQVAEFRMSMLGKLAHYASYMTAAAGHSVAVVCHASEDAYETWRPRFEAFVAGIRLAGTRKQKGQR